MATNIREPFERIENLQEYVTNRSYHQEAGWINGRFLFRSKWYEVDEFLAIYPLEIKYRATQIDKTQISR